MKRMGKDLERSKGQPLVKMIKANSLSSQPSTSTNSSNLLDIFEITGPIDLLKLNTRAAFKIHLPKWTSFSVTYRTERNIWERVIQKISEIGFDQELFCQAESLIIRLAIKKSQFDLPCLTFPLHPNLMVILRNQIHINQSFDYEAPSVTKNFSPNKIKALLMLNREASFDTILKMSPILLSKSSSDSDEAPLENIILADGAHSRFEMMSLHRLSAQFGGNYLIPQYREKPFFNSSYSTM